MIQVTTIFVNITPTMGGCGCCPFCGGGSVVSAAVFNSLVVFVPQVVIKLLSGVCVCFRCYDKA